MRHIEVEQDLLVRFPSRGAEFDDGVAIGIAAAKMAQYMPSIEVQVTEASVEQLQKLAQRLSYRVATTSTEEEMVGLTLEPVGMRPRLRVVSSA